MKKKAIILMILTVITKFFGFAREITLSYFYGTSGISDAFLIALTIPTVVFSFIGLGLYTGYIPLYSKLESESGILKANEFTGNLVNILLIICTILIIICSIFMEELIKIFASGFEGEILTLTVWLTRISLLSIYFTGLIHIFKGYLQIKNMYIVPALMSFPMNIFLLLSIAFSKQFGMEVLGIGIVIAIASEFILLIPFIRKNGYTHKLGIDLKDENVHKLYYLALPVIFGVSVNQINVLVDRTLASQIVIGGISALNYANKLNLFIQGIFVMSLITILYPNISKMVVNGNILGLKNVLRKALVCISIFVVPASFGSIIFAEQIVTLLFGRGAFDAEAIRLTTTALLFYSIGMIGFGFREILSRVFFSLQDTKTPMINATLGVVLNIVLNLILARYLGIGGLALATSLAATITTILLFVSLHKKVGSFGMKELSVSFVKILIASLAMSFLAIISFNYLLPMLSQNISLLIAISIGMLSYFIIISLMRIKDVELIINAIKKKITKYSA
jgi:putative peptidoglycan lipid II flippase